MLIVTNGRVLMFVIIVVRDLVFLCSSIFNTIALIFLDWFWSNRHETMEGRLHHSPDSASSPSVHSTSFFPEVRFTAVVLYRMTGYCDHLICFMLQQEVYCINPFKRQVKSHLPSAGIIRSSPYYPR